MPELGKATYLLELNTAGYNTATDAVEARTTGMVDAVEGQLTLLDESWGRVGVAAESAAQETEVASTQMAAASERASVANRTAAAKSESGWAASFASIKRMSRLVLGGALALDAYEAIKRISERQRSFSLITNAIRDTGKVAGVSAGYILKLTQALQYKTAVDRAQLENAAQIELRFTNIRDSVGKGNDIFTRLLTIVNSVAAATGKGLIPTTIALSKALNDPIKYLGALARTGVTFTTSQQNQIKAMVAAGHVQQAQGQLLTWLEHKYRSAGEAAANSLGGKLKILKFAIYDVTEAALVKLTPAINRITTAMSNWAEQAVKPGTHANEQLTSILKQLGGILRTIWAIIKVGIGIIKEAAKLTGGWTNLVKILIAAWVGYKTAKVAEAVWGMVTAIRSATAVTITAEAVTAPFVATLIAAAAAAVGLGLALDWLSSKLPGHPFQTAGKAIADLFNGTPSSIPVSAAQARAEGAALLKKQGPHGAALPLGESRDASGNILDSRTGKIIKRASTTRGAAKPPTKADVSQPKPTGGAAASIFGPGYTALQDRLAQARQTTGLADDKTALKNLADYLRKRISLYKIGSAEHLKLENALTSVLGKLNTGIVSSAKKAKATADSAFNDRIKIELARASLLGGAAGAAKTARVQEEIRKHELAIYTAEENGLRKRLRDKSLTLKEQATLWAQLASIDKKRLALAKQQNAGLTADDKEIAAFEDLRGTFFGQFASSIFNSTGAGLAPGVQTAGNKTINIEQNHTYNEIPKNKFAIARQMRIAAVAAHL